ncbi:MAG: sigma-70 family RNA polymerase sigma factor, partial [Thermoleophilaceae bacterium]
MDRDVAQVEGGVVHDESQAWVAALRGSSPGRDEALARLHGLLLRGARFELNRRRPALGHVSAREVDDLATEAADDALVAILA